jgi:hypothetical protein
MAAVLANTNITLDNTSAITIPGTPSAGQTVIYPKADKLLYYKNDAGQELPPGKVVQVVNFQTGAVATGTTVIPFDDTIPQITEGDEYMTLAITPTNASNILIISVAMASLGSALANRPTVALFVDAVADALASSNCKYVADAEVFTFYFSHRMVAGTTSERTFRVRAGGNIATTLTFNGNGGTSRFGGSLASSITITEVTA